MKLLLSFKYFDNVVFLRIWISNDSDVYCTDNGSIRYYFFTCSMALQALKGLGTLLARVSLTSWN